MVEETSADILLLQEVDLNSRRSHYLNQLHHLQERLAWPYAACNRNQIHQQVTYPELAKRHDFVFFSSEFEYVSSTVVDNISSSDHLPVHVVPKLRD